MPCKCCGWVPRARPSHCAPNAQFIYVLQVHVAGCRELIPPGRSGAACRPYVHYRFPGHRDPHTTKMLYGLNPVYKDEATWLLARTPDVEASFKTREMQVCEVWGQVRLR